MTNVKLYVFWIYIVILFKLYQVVTVELQSRGYTSVPHDNISTNATNLDLRNNNITMLQQNVFINYSSLVTLDISHNKINMIHASAFNGLLRLKTLILKGNLLQYFSIPTPGLSKLQELNLAQNQLQEFPDIKSSIKTIKKLNVLSNQIKNISLESVYGSSIPSITAEALTHLYLRGNNMADGTIDNRLWPTMPNLQRLEIQNMGLQIFPDLQALKDLRKLFVQKNALTSIGNMEKLEKNKKLNHINVNDNEFTSVIDFVRLVENYTSSSVNVFLRGTKLICDANVCWMKYMSA